MVVGDIVIRARGNKQPLRARAVADERAPGVMTIEREPTLQPAAQRREPGDPAAVSRESVAIVQPVATRQPLQREIRERRARLADREARMRPPLEQDDVVPLHGEHTREQRAGEAAADDRYAHAGQGIRGGGSGLVLRFIVWMRATRCGRQLSQPDSRSISQTSAVTTADVIARQRSSVVSSCLSVGGTKWPSDWSRSISPLPPRTGMIAMRLAPRAAAYSTVRTVHSIDSSAGTYGAPRSANARRSISCSARKAAARSKRSKSSRLLRCPTATG